MTELTGLHRNTNDKFYTKNNIVELCIEYFKQYILLSDGDLIIEPAAGDGAFIHSIKSMANTVGCHYKFYDIEPENDEIIKQDYLQLKIDVDDYDRIHILSNPPFGRQSSVVKQFIKKSCKYVDSISFILPKSFKKSSFQKTFKLNFHLVFQIDLPKNSFTVNGIEYDVPCVFQIWKKENFNRPSDIIMLPNNFIFVKKNENPDVSFQRVGSKAGKFDILINEKNIQSHYFIKFLNNKTIDENLNILKSITFEFDNTVGPKSISKQELIIKINNLLEV
jgi:hypothetical protein